MALPNDISRMCDELVKMASSALNFTGSKKKAARTFARRSWTFEKAAADAMAADATAHTASASFRAPCDGFLLGAYYNSRGTLTAHASNNAVLTMNKSDGAGGAATAMATGTTTAGGTGSFVAGGIASLTVSATVANRRFTKGQLLSFAIAKGASGVVVPIGLFQIDVELEGLDDYEVV